MSSYTIKQLSDLAKISWHALHCYDQIGLLESGTYGANGYRRYRREAVLRRRTSQAEPGVNWIDHAEMRRFDTGILA